MITSRLPYRTTRRTLALELLVILVAGFAGALVCEAIGGTWPPPAAASGDEVVAHEVVAHDHAARTTLADRTTEPDDLDGADRDPKPPPRSTWSRVYGLLSKASWFALGGAAMMIAARGLGALRARKKRLRKGLLGYVTGAMVTGGVIAGGAIALSGSLDAGVMALTGVVVAALGLARDPETGKVPATAAEGSPS